MDTLFSLPDDATLYRALTERDPAYEGRAWVGVRTTGIFCRLTCPARKPRPENCQWFDSPAAALGAGFRPCLRCRPVAPEAEGDPVVRRMLEALASDPALMVDPTGPTLPERLSDRDWRLLSAAMAERGTPAVVTSKLRPMMPSGAIVWASPARERNWAMHITKMKSASRAGERPVSGVSAAASDVWPSECFAVGESVDLRLGALRDPESFSGIEAMIGCCERRCPG